MTQHFGQLQVLGTEQTGERFVGYKGASRDAAEHYPRRSMWDMDMEPVKTANKLYAGLSRHMWKERLVRLGQGLKLLYLRPQSVADPVGGVADEQSSS